MLQFVQRNVKVDWWLTKGALLGAIRNKGHNETDIDVAVNGSQWRKFGHLQDLPGNDQKAEVKPRTACLTSVLLCV